MVFNNMKGGDPMSHGSAVLEVGIVHSCKEFVG